MRGMNVEGFAAYLRRKAGIRATELVMAPTIVARLMGDGALGLAPGLASAACLTAMGGRHVILLREFSHDSNFDIMHECAHWALRVVWGRPSDDTERNANALAAAILAPPQLLLSAHRKHRSLQAMSNELMLSQTATFLRLGEVLRDERAVVTRSGNVLVRTQGAFPWASVPVVDVARGRRWPGLSRAHLRGGIDDGRVALRVG
jgi:hypothetical protein